MEISPTTCFTDEEHAEELLKELSEDGHDLDEMKFFNLPASPVKYRIRFESV